ncbi:Crp/Fnr family transcriptional regulator [Miniphocaeibacter massiliensis]|uniref:Crp/Fnr family transcriptional regulator n=1 Tax=Miniphocaeibacter massiliensis TaxID=2041841 RepID=UPI000C1C6084|nr:Crp/Fnr family transcriptional regulator [Miniphocaeibacter massiliensis]
MNNVILKLKTNPLFNNMTDSEIRDTLIYMNYSIKNYIKNQYIFYEGDLLNEIGIILNGKIQVIRDDYFGQRSIVANLESGDILGESVAIVKNTKAPASTFIVENSTVIWLNFDVLKKDYNKKFIFNLLQLLSKKNLYLNERLRTVSRRTLREKILTYLDGQRKKNNSNKFNVPLNRNEMADFLLVDRASLSRELSKLQKEGFIKFSKNNFEILK